MANLAHNLRLEALRANCSLEEPLLEPLRFEHLERKAGDGI